MVRRRLAFLGLAGGLLYTVGCTSLHDHECSSGGWFSRFRLASRTTTAAPCECEGGVPALPVDSTMVVPPNGYVPPPPAFPVVPPQAFPVTPPPSIITNPPGSPPVGTQPPRIVPVPQAPPSAYTP